ncbi:MAG: hypothetical protein QW035_01440 [Candidatus Anstonellales archaeon]
MSKFVKVKCKCGNVQIIFTHTTTKINCSGCNATLAAPTGGRAAIIGTIVEELG